MASTSESPTFHLGRASDKDETDGYANTVKGSTDQGSPSIQHFDHFPRIWQRSTMDNNISLHSFRRFKTTHLINLRFLEEEIADVDRRIYQAGLSLGLEPTSADRIGLKACRRDTNVPKVKETINPSLILHLRSMIKEYDEALASFNQIMSMETVSMADGGYDSIPGHDLSAQEMCNARLVRVDLGPRTSQDRFQRHVHKFFRTMRVRSLLKTHSCDEEANSLSRSKRKSSTWVQDSILFSEIVGRFLIAILTAAFLIIPLVISAYQKTKGAQLCTIGVSVLIFAFLVSFSMRITSHETMAIASAYAAVLSVIVSNGFA
ncbi:uncharacterized protein PAC_01367 [Phialocephala subalpina]|uniref:DUF6594 domain-containing protein n=1 Tax=Phialocephala subalpina TaxID=576137 RepID=A0A1L7WFE0_9HELO|nr:uncharacterized protein PAC_01367 [Phialocephala subalpina]